MTRHPRTVNFGCDFVKVFVCITAIDYTTLQRLLGRLGKHKTQAKQPLCETPSGTQQETA